MTKVYIYKNCSTCRDALKFLDAKEVAYKILPIREQPPSERELKTMLKIYGGEIRKLFNSSGLDYKALNLKEKLPAMTETEALQLLTKNGNLVKRPFVLTENSGVVGFKEEQWRKLF